VWSEDSICVADGTFLVVVVVVVVVLSVVADSAMAMVGQQIQYKTKLSCYGRRRHEDGAQLELLQCTVVAATTDIGSGKHIGGKKVQ
jgi:hypothetical protein